MNDYLIAGFVLLGLSAVSFGWGMMWLIAWFNQVAKFVMQIYKDEKANIPPQYAYMPPIFLAAAFLFCQVGKFLLTYAATMI